MSEVPEPIRGQSPGVAWRRLTHGVHLTAAESTTAHELAGWQLLLPARGCFTHLTAAALRGWWLPPLPEALPVFVSMGQSDPRPLRAGIRTFRPAHPVAFEVIDGLRVARSLEILLACAHDLALIDLVVLLDGAAFVGDIDLVELGKTLQNLRRRRGLRKLRAALCLADPRSESPWETLLRLLLTLCGVAVEPQFVVPGPHGPLARADLLVSGTKTLQEYDGEVHLARAQQKRDLRRLRRLDRGGWTRHGYIDDDVLHRAVGILADADRALGREHLASRIRPWHDAVRESCFTPSGRSRLARRLGVEPSRQGKAGNRP